MLCPILGVRIGHGLSRNFVSQTSSSTTAAGAITTTSNTVNYRPTYTHILPQDTNSSTSTTNQLHAYTGTVPEGGPGSAHTGFAGGLSFLPESAFDEGYIEIDKAQNIGSAYQSTSDRFVHGWRYIRGFFMAPATTTLEYSDAQPGEGFDNRNTKPPHRTRELMSDTERELWGEGGYSNTSNSNSTGYLNDNSNNSNGNFFGRQSPGVMSSSYSYGTMSRNSSNAGSGQDSHAVTNNNRPTTTNRKIGLGPPLPTGINSNSSSRGVSSAGSKSKYNLNAATFQYDDESHLYDEDEEERNASYFF